MEPHRAGPTCGFSVPALLFPAAVYLRGCGVTLIRARNCRVDRKMEDLLGQISRLDREEENRVLSAEEACSRVEAKRELQKLMKLEERSWKQKSRVRWRDKNTKCFHRVANARRRANALSRLMVDGEFLEDQGSIRNHVVEFYERLYSDPVPWRPTLDGLKFQRLGTDQAQWLERDLDEEEILAALRDLGGERAPGPE